jgi:hypothetical protein
MAYGIFRFLVLLAGMMFITSTVLVLVEGCEIFKAICLSAVTATLKSVWAVIHHRIFHVEPGNAEEIIEECY